MWSIKDPQPRSRDMSCAAHILRFWCRMQLTLLTWSNGHGMRHAMAPAIFAASQASQAGRTSPVWRSWAKVRLAWCTWFDVRGQRKSMPWSRSGRTTSAIRIGWRPVTTCQNWYRANVFWDIVRILWGYCEAETWKWHERTLTVIPSLAMFQCLERLVAWIWQNVAI